VWSQVYRALFRERENPMIEKMSSKKKKQEEDKRDQKYKRFNGRVIRRIRIQTLDVFGAKVYDTLALPKNALEIVGNHLHITSKGKVIRNQLNFEPGDRFISTLISNNERVLRQTGFLVDARILPILSGWKDSIDILVVTQDIFTLFGGVGGAPPDNISFDLVERNFLGLNHRMTLKYQYIGKSVPKQVNNFRVNYLIPYISPRSFISAEAEVYYYFDRKTVRSRIFRDFLFTNTRRAGSAEVRVSDFRVGYLSGDTVAVAQVGQNVADGWMGYAFKVRDGGDEADRSRLVLSGRVVSTRYRYKPFSSPDSNQTFRNSDQVLGSVGYVDRDYYRDVLVNGYGRTEDIPFGLAATITAGFERNSNNNRQYVGVRYGQARFLPLGGYLNYSLDVGSFIRNCDIEQGAIRLDALYFSKLIHIGRVHIRQFARFRYVDGLNRFDTEFLTIASENGIRGTGSRSFEGLTSLVINLETVTFLNFDVLSFKAAPFWLTDLGWASKPDKKLLDRSPYWGLGLGLRLYNERLAFTNIQLRLSYYPNVPGLASPFKTNFARGASFDLQDFAIKQPTIVQYQ
jgi:hypothetical protein